MAVATAAAVNSMHHDIEVTTRRLELEKRRLQRLEKELATARRSYETKVGRRPSKSRRDSSQEVADTSRRSLTTSRGLESPRAKSSRPGRSLPRRLQQGAYTDRGRSLGASCGAASCGEGSRALPEEPAPCRTLVNRLDVQLKKLDSIRHENANLRTEVDAIRQQRLQLNGIFERLRVEIRQRGAQLADFVEETEASRGVHNDAKLRVAVMRRQREVERNNFKTQVLRIRKDLQNTDHERKEIEVQLKRATEGVQKKKELIVPREEHGFSEACMMRRIMKAAFLNCIQRRHIKQHQRNIEVFEQAFATIKQSTGISNIEEIVRIFISLESRNFSLLTYVNHMNREIETLEGARKWRQDVHMARRSNEEQSEQQRNQALADLKKQLQATSKVVVEERESCSEHRSMVQSIRPSILQISKRIQSEMADMKKAVGALAVDDLPRLPPDLREENLPEWLDWVENALGKFRDVMPKADDQEPAFPPTAAGQVRQLPPKRFHRHPGGQQPLVKTQDLPTAFTLNPDDPSLTAQKRAHATGLSVSQKAELLDDDSEEEDFEKMPLMLKDLRYRAQQALAKKRRRNVNFRAGETSRTEDLGGTATTATTATPSRGPSRAAAHTPGRASPMSDATPTARRSSQTLGEVSPGSELEEDKDFGQEEGAAAQAEDGGTNEASAQGGGGAEDGQRGASLPATSEELPELFRTRRAIQAQLAERLASGEATAQEISEEELDLLFLKRYKMNREELELVASRMGIHLSNLCFVKQEFDLFDEDRSGCIDAAELRNLLGKLGEEPSPQELEAALVRLDADGTGEVEFFEFCAWFTSDE